MLAELTIEDEAAGAAFAHAGTRAIIFELMKSEQSLTQLKAATGMSLSLLHYHLARLEQLGLVNVASITRRPGRPIRRYRAAASEFRVPASVAGRTAGAGLKQEMELALQRAEARQPAMTSYSIDAQGRPRMRRLPAASLSGAHQRWWRLRLSESAAALLAEEIADLLARYETSNNATGKPHLCHFALVRT